MIEKIRKAGIITKGFIYSLIGILTFLAALGVGGKVSGKNGVLNFLQNQTFGNILLGIIAVGLLGYAIWRIYSAFLDAKNEGDDKKGYAKRIGYFVSGLIYGALGVSTVSSLIGGNTSQGGDTKESLVSTILNQSYGQTLIYIVGGILLLVGFYQLYKGLTKKFLEDIKNQGSVESTEVLEKSGMIGFSARGIAFIIFAFFVFKAANQDNADNVRGVAGMFEFLQNMQFGNVLMGAMALGLLAYGVFQYFLARYSTIYN